MPQIETVALEDGFRGRYGQLARKNRKCAANPFPAHSHEQVSKEGLRSSKPSANPRPERGWPSRSGPECRIRPKTLSAGRRAAAGPAALRAQVCQGLLERLGGQFPGESVNSHAPGYGVVRPRFFRVVPPLDPTRAFLPPSGAVIPPHGPNRSTRSRPHAATRAVTPVGRRCDKPGRPQHYALCVTRFA